MPPGRLVSFGAQGVINNSTRPRVTKWKEALKGLTFRFGRSLSMSTFFSLCVSLIGSVSCFYLATLEQFHAPIHEVVVVICTAALSSTWKLFTFYISLHVLKFLLSEGNTSRSDGRLRGLGSL